MTRHLFSATERQEPTKGSLGDVLSHEANDVLLRTLERIDQHVRDVRRADAGRPSDPAILDRLAQAAGRPDAPFEVRWLADRVAAGELGWPEVWAAPEEHSGGMWLWSGVVGDQARVAGGDDA
jgi:hypothetical protein